MGTVWFARSRSLHSPLYPVSQCSTLSPDLHFGLAWVSIWCPQSESLGTLTLEINTVNQWLLHSINESLSLRRYQEGHGRAGSRLQPHKGSGLLHLNEIRAWAGEQLGRAATCLEKACLGKEQAAPLPQSLQVYCGKLTVQEKSPYFVRPTKF